MRRSRHDVSDGGLAVALAEMALAGGRGARVQAHHSYSKAGWWFGEDQGRHVLTVKNRAAFEQQLAWGENSFDRIGGAIRHIGTVGGDELLGVPLADLRAAHEGFFPALMQGEL